MSTEPFDAIKDRLEVVESRIERACQRAGRRRDEITLVAVSKVFPAEAILGGYGAGLRVFGENYVQEFEAKRPLLGELPGAVFHLIGHLQSNKAARAAELFDTIQTVDSAKLARRLAACGRKLDVMIEVKLSDEESKHGAPPEALAEIVDAVQACPELRLAGFMTMPPWTEEPEPSRPYFRRLRELSRPFAAPALSMGMSNDFEVAIEEGATHIRVGTALFGRRRRPA